MATEANSDGQAPFKMKGFSVSRIMQTALEAMKTFEEKGRWVQAVFDFGLDGKEPSFFEEGERAETSFNMVRPWLEEQRKRKQGLSEQGRRGGQAPKDPASYYGNKNAQKHPPQVSPLEKGRRDAQEGKDTEEAKAYLANTAEVAAFVILLQFAENLGLPADRLAFTGTEFEALEAKLKDPALSKEALFRARAGKFSRFAEWETAKKEKQVLKLAPLLKSLFAEIETDLAKERAKDATPKETGAGNASTQDPARPPQNSIQASRESARKLPSENTAQEVAPAEEPKNKKPKLWAGLFKQKCARALDVPESALELKQAEFEEIKAGLEGAGALRNLLRTARQEAQTKQGQKMRKDLLKGGKLPLRLYASTLWKYEEAYFNANATERKALRAERAAQPFLYKAPPRLQKGKAK